MFKKVAIAVIGLALLTVMLGIAAQNNQSAREQQQELLEGMRPPGVALTDWVMISRNVGIVLKNAKTVSAQGKIVGTIMIKRYSENAWHELIIDNSTGRRGNEPASTSFLGNTPLQ